MINLPNFRKPEGYVKTLHIWPLCIHMFVSFHLLFDERTQKDQWETKCRDRLKGWFWKFVPDGSPAWLKCFQSSELESHERETFQSTTVQSRCAKKQCWWRTMCHDWRIPTFVKVSFVIDLLQFYHSHALKSHENRINS